MIDTRYASDRTKTLSSITYHGGQATAVWQTGPATFVAQYHDGDDWQWTGVCASPERARYAAWRGIAAGMDWDERSVA